MLQNEKWWQKWWPSQSAKNSSGELSYKNYSYKINKAIYEIITISINHNKTTYPATIRLLSLGADSTLLQLSTAIDAGSNPFIKVKKYIEARRLKDNIDAVIQSYRSFMQKQENVYGIKLQQEKVKDTILVSIRITTTAYPSTNEVYALIAKLKNHIHGSGAKETNYPMLHVEVIPGEKRYETMVAIPVDKLLEGTGDYKPKKMVDGKIITAEIRGGIHTIEEGILQMENYIDEHKKVSPAIPFQSLVTDRLKEKDTSNWITKIYYPIL